MIDCQHGHSKQVPLNEQNKQHSNARPRIIFRVRTTFATTLLFPRLDKRLQNSFQSNYRFISRTHHTNLYHSTITIQIESDQSKQN